MLSGFIRVVVCKESRHCNGKDRGYIGMLSVEKSWRHRGIGKHTTYFIYNFIVEQYDTSSEDSGQSCVFECL